MSAALLFGHPVLHQRISILTDILAALLQRSPDGLRQGELGRLTGHAPRDLVRHCSVLWQAQLIAPTADGGWRTLPQAQALTLEDVYRCALAGIAGEPALTIQDSRMVNVERLLGQAALALDLAIGKELRAFPLARLCAGAAPPMAFCAAPRYSDPVEAGYHAAFKSDQEMHP